jgi:flagellar basal body-associated protein FliL
LKKNKKLIIILVICLVVVVGVPIFIYDALHGNFIRDYSMENQVKEHLVLNGYTEEDVLSIEAEYNMKFNTNRIKGTFAYVVFKDEPKEKYVYVQWRETGKVQQECSYYSEDTGAYEVKYTEERKHMIQNCY